MKSRIYLTEKVNNKDRKFGSAIEYYPAEIVTGWLRRPALFTPAQISDAIARAEANPEDIPRPGWWERLQAWLRTWMTD